MSLRRPARAWQARSLRFRLTAVATGVLGVGLVAGSVALSALLAGSRVAALDRLATERVEAVAALAAVDRLPAVLPVEQPGEMVQVLDAQGRVVATSATASRTLPLLPPDRLSGLADGRTFERTAYTASPVRAVARPATWRGAPVTVLAVVPLRDVLDAFRALRLALLVVVPLLTGVVGAVCWALLGRALRPVEDLRAGAERVTALGGGGTLPVPPGGDELAGLARTLNAMLDRLQAAGERQSAFVADAAHELRSPLTALRTSIEVAQAHPSAYDAAELAADLSEEVLRLSRLVDDLLVLARLGATPRHPRALDLAELAGSLVQGRAGWVTGAGHAYADADAVRRVLRNLLDNAVRHARGRVRVSVQDGCVVVDDDGPGVPVAERERVFERFHRLDEGRARDAGGSGLGLSIARETAREQGGDVVLAESPLGGARLVLTLPTAPPGSSAARDSRQKGGSSRSS